MRKNNVILRRIVIGTFLSVPVISSSISTVHLIDLFNLGNPIWLSILLAVTFELGSIASLLAISVIERINTGAIWFIFFVLAGLQILGNVYYSYTFTSTELLANQNFLVNFTDLFSFLVGDDIKDVKVFLSCIIGIPIPLIALFFLKSNMDYLKINSDKSNTTEDVDSVEVTEDFSEPLTETQNEEKNEEPIKLTSEQEASEFIDQEQQNYFDETAENSLGHQVSEEQEPVGDARRRRTRVIGNAQIKY